MRSIFRNLVLSSLALCATAAFAAHETRLEVPFDFVAKGHAYQAGPYVIRIDSARSFVTLSNIMNSAPPLTWIVVPGDTDPYHPKVALTFDVTGTEYALRTIQYGALITPNLNAHPKQRVDQTRIIGQ
jgi:hypothetical protein